LGNGGDERVHSSDLRFRRRGRQSRRYPGLPDVQPRDRTADSGEYIFPRTTIRCSVFIAGLANLRVLEVGEIKTIPGTLRSHAFVERLLGTIRRELLDRTFFWGQGDLERKLEAYQAYYNQHRCHAGLAGFTPAQRSGAPSPPTARLDSYRWRRHCNGLFQTPAAA
jgi:Integrase core domain